jgi:hypothetical protein
MNHERDDLDGEQQHLRPELRFLLWQFEGRILDDSCLAEMAKTLNQELASELDGRTIHLLRDDSGIRVDVVPPMLNETASDQSTGPSQVGYDAVATALAA